MKEMIYIYRFTLSMPIKMIIIQCMIELQPIFCYGTITVIPQVHH